MGKLQESQYVMLVVEKLYHHVEKQQDDENLAI